MGVESCGAASGCACSNQRAVETQTQAGPACGPVCTAVDFVYTYPAFSSDCGTQTRTEVESCAAAAGCACSNQRAVNSQSQENAACEVHEEKRECPVACNPFGEAGSAGAISWAITTEQNAVVTAVDNSA